MLRTPYLPGDSDVDQVHTIFRALGTPTDEDWPVSVIAARPVAIFAYIVQGHASLPNYIAVPHHDKMPFRDLFTAASTEAISLLAKFLAYDPKRRLSARDVRLSIKTYVRRLTARHLKALHHAYFFSMPNPTHHTKLPKPKAAAAESPQQSPALDGTKKQPTAAAAAPTQDPSRVSRKRKASGVLESSRANVAKRLDFSVPTTVVST